MGGERASVRGGAPREARTVRGQGKEEGGGRGLIGICRDGAAGLVEGVGDDGGAGEAVRRGGIGDGDGERRRRREP